eukprot:COSAG05_NODE_25395_length_197_cov_46.326531_1_plen_23_part_01
MYMYLGNNNVQCTCTLGMYVIHI